MVSCAESSFLKHPTALPKLNNSSDISGSLKTKEVVVELIPISASESQQPVLVMTH
jgi:hypothetical protein